MSLSAGKRKQFRCSYCFRDVTNVFRVQCAVCVDFHLCHDCFSAGVVLNPHDPSHDYKIPECLEIPLFVKDWTVNDEMTLLDGIEKHGAGNWKTISEMLLPHKTTKQIEEHYWELYMGVHGYCLPSKVILNDNAVETSSYFPNQASASSSSSIDAEGAPVVKLDVDVEATKDDLNRTRIVEGYTLGEVVKRDIGKESNYKGGRPAGNDKNEKGETKEKVALPGSDLPGYIPLREDFDVEFENDAELLLADMEFTPEDHPSELELKLQVIRIYNNKLNERDRRKKFVIERGLIDCKSQQAADRKRSKEERELVAKMRVFARFQTQAEHEALVDGILKARRLRQQIELYKHYRQMGIKTLEQARIYESDRKIKDRDMKAKSRRDTPSYGNGENGRNVGSSWTESASNGRSSVKGVVMEEIVNSSMVTSGSSSQLSAEGGKNGGPGRRKSRVTIEDTAAPLPVIPEDDSKGKRTGRYSLKSEPESTNSKRAKHIVDVDGDVVTEQQLADIANAPGGDVLGDAEIELCARVPMLPLHYLAAKDALVREAYGKGLLTHDGIKRILKLEPKKTTAIYDFFVKELLINEPTVTYPPVVSRENEVN